MRSGLALAALLLSGPVAVAQQAGKPSAPAFSPAKARSRPAQNRIFTLRWQAGDRRGYRDRLMGRGRDGDMDHLPSVGRRAQRFCGSAREHLLRLTARAAVSGDLSMPDRGDRKTSREAHSWIPLVGLALLLSDR
jgi:hypothetical protein